MVGVLVIQKMDLCGLVQGVTCDLTGFYRLMIANRISASWRQVRWMRVSLSSMSLPAGTVAPEHQRAALKHIRARHDYADRDLQGLIIPHGIITGQL